MQKFKQTAISLNYSLEERISNRTEISSQEFSALIQAADEKREAYTFTKILESEEVWTAFLPEGLFELGLKNDSWGVCIWPAREFAEDFAKSYQHDRLNCVPIPLDDFIDEIAFDQHEKREIIIFPLGNASKLTVLSANTFLNKLEKKWHQEYGEWKAL